MDILFNDQNAPDMGGQLAAAELVYRWAPFHYALMLLDPFSKGWCLYELLIRILAGMAALGLARAAELVLLILRRDARFTRLVIVEGLTNVDNDVTGTFYDRFGEMTTFKPSDMADIKRAIVEKVGSAAAFNLLVSSYRHAAIQNTSQVRRLDGLRLGGCSSEGSEGRAGRSRARRERDQPEPWRRSRVPGTLKR